MITLFQGTRTMNNEKYQRHDGTLLHCETSVTIIPRIGLRGKSPGKSPEQLVKSMVSCRVSVKKSTRIRFCGHRHHAGVHTLEARAHPPWCCGGPHVLGDTGAVPAWRGYPQCPRDGHHWFHQNLAGNVGKAMS